MLKHNLFILIRSAVGELIADIFGSSDEEEEFEASFGVFALTLNVNNYLCNCIREPEFCQKTQLFNFISNMGAVVLVVINTTHTHPFNGPMPGTTQVSRFQKGKTNLDFTEARDSEWQ